MGDRKLCNMALLDLKYPEKVPPVAILALAALTGTELNLKPDAKLSDSDQPILLLPARSVPACILG